MSVLLFYFVAITAFLLRLNYLIHAENRFRFRSLFIVSPLLIPAVIYVSSLCNNSGDSDIYLLLELAITFMSAMCLITAGIVKWDIIAFAGMLAGGIAHMAGLLMILLNSVALYDKPDKQHNICNTIMPPGAMFVAAYAIINGISTSFFMLQPEVIGMIFVAAIGLELVDIFSKHRNITANSIFFTLLSGAAAHAALSFFSACYLIGKVPIPQSPEAVLPFPAALHVSGHNIALSPVFALLLWIFIVVLIELYFNASQKPLPSEGALQDQHILGRFSP